MSGKGWQVNASKCRLIPANQRGGTGPISHGRGMTARRYVPGTRPIGRRWLAETLPESRGSRRGRHGRNPSITLIRYETRVIRYPMAASRTWA